MAYAGGYDWEQHSRQTLLRTHETLERTSQSINNSHQISIETEQIGTNVIGELNEQRESLLRSKGRLQNMDEGLSKSQRIIKKMQKHVFYNKFILIAIILLEIGILSGLIYIHFFIKK